MDHIFEQYGKIITSIIGILIAVAMVATAGGIMSNTLNESTTKLVSESEVSW